MKINRNLEKRWQEAGITNDFIFGNVMIRHDNCKCLLQAILPQLKIETVTINRQKVIQFDNRFKGVRLDLFVIDQDHTEYDIEMQIKTRDFQGQRARYYLSKMDEEILRSGKSYRGLKNSYVIILCPEDPFAYNLKRYDFEYRCKQNLKLKLDTKTEIIFLNSKGKIGEVSKDLTEFFKLMNKQKTNTTPFIKQISNDLNKVKQSAEVRHDFMDWQMELDDVKYNTQKDTQKADIIKSIKMLKKVHATEQQIITQINSEYPNSYDQKTLLDLIRKTK